jgi:DNA-directed RNA polymerase sigma subunit (sigma70/sigma32)
MIREMHDLQRKATRGGAISLDEPIGEEDDATRAETLAVEQDDEIDAGLYRQELWRYIIDEGARKRFSDDSKDVILGGYLLGKNDRELAREIGTSQGNITVIRYRNFQKLRNDPDFMERFGDKRKGVVE